MIKITALNKYYTIGDSRFHALKNIDFELPEGEMVSIQGRSGAGKSTMLNILGCLDTFDSGNYFFDDINVSQLSDSRAAKLRNEKIGFILQDFSLINQKSVLFNTMLPMYFGRTPYREMKAKAMNLLERLGVVDQAAKEVSRLSGGQRQRVAIARALVSEPELILADEPTGALDTKTSGAIIEVLADLNRCGISIIIVTHDDHVAELCPRRYYMEDGMLYEK